MQIDTNTPPENAAFLQAVGIAALFYSPPELARWLQSPQPLLNNATPLQLLANGQTMPLFEVMQRLDAGVYI
jgi:uncharacterized protein (DUF2384 family)